MKAAFAEVNAAGGVHGREIRMDPKDDGYVAARTLKNVTEMVEAQSMFALISPLGTANTASILPLVESKGIPTVGPVTGATSLRAPGNKHVFFLRPTYREETQRLVKQIVDMGLKRIAVVYLDNPFGKEVLKDMSAALDEIKAKAEQLEAESRNWDEQSDQQMHQHHRWAQAMTAIQIAISLAAITLLTRKEWLRRVSFGAAGVGVMLGSLAWLHI